MKSKITQGTIQGYGLSTHALSGIHDNVYPDIIKDSKLYDAFKKNPEKVLEEYGIDVPKGLKINLLEAEEATAHFFLPPKELQSYLDELNSELNAAFASTAAEPYVQVEAKWWGLVFILSDQAAKDLASGQGGVTGVMGALAAILAVLPPPANAVALIPGLLAGILTLHAAAIGLMNRGRGVYITALWTVLHLPLSWIPTPR